MRISILALLLLASCASSPSAAGETARLHAAFVREYAALDPNWATGVGLHDHDAKLTRYDDASYTARRRCVERALAALRAIVPSSPDERIDHRLFLAGLELDVHEYARVDYRTISPDLPLGAVNAVHQLLLKDFASKEQRVADAVARLRQFKDVCADARAALRRPPKLWTEMAIDDLAGSIEFLEKEVIALAGETARAAAGEACEAFKAYRSFLKSDVLPRSDGSFALGRTEFDYRLRTALLLPYDAARLAAIGDAELRRTLSMLDECAQRIDPKRTWQEILKEMFDDHPRKDELLQVYRAEVARARQYMIDKSIVGLPEEKLEVIETPPFERSTTPFAAYNGPAPLDSSRLGHFYVTPEPEAHIRSDIPGTVWHEAYPGHHLQFVYAKDVPSIVRRLNDSPLLSEGWGFYCEELAYETGYYDDPKERLMQLNWRLQRAARIILDVGVHTGRYDYDAAVKFLVEQVRMSEGSAKASVNAYTQRPTYFSCYMVGMLEIVRIREKLKGRLGARYSLKEFHERVLRCGNIPPALIEETLDREWKG